MALDASSHDAGVVDQGDPIRHPFVIGNEGGRPLEIIRTRTTCDCAVAGVEQEIAPGGQGTITVDVDTNRANGPTTRTITLFTNDPETPRAALEIAADVQPHVVVEPWELYVGEVLAGQEIDESIAITFPRQPQARVSQVGEIEGPVVANIAPAASGTVLEVRIDENAAPGLFEATVNLETTHPEMPIVEVTVAGMIMPRPDGQPMEASQAPAEATATGEPALSALDRE